MALAKNLQYLLSEEAKSRKDSPLKSAFKYRSLPGMRSLGGGLPIPELFPFDNLNFCSPAPPFSQGVELPDFGVTEVVKSQISREIGAPPQSDIELATALQYGNSLGDERLRNFIKEHTNKVHSIPYSDWDVMTSVGNTFTWDATLRTFTNRGDVILVEEFAFSSALETANALGCVAVGVRMDLEGIVPEALEAQMARWVGKRPKLLYTVPTGQNPTGSTLSASRRQQIYAIAQKYDFLIIEDEPYYYLQFPAYQKTAAERASTENGSAQSMLASFAPSFLNFDVDGRVIRLDSFSKVLAPGTRLSWIVAQSRFIERFLRLQETTAQNPSGFSSAIVYGLLRRWGQAGYLEWLYQLKTSYALQRDVACDAIVENFPPNKFAFEPPTSGMFYWFKIDARRYRKFAELGKDVDACEMALFHELIANNVLIAPGQWFISRAQTSPPQPALAKTEDEQFAMYFRGTFAGVNAETLRSALTDVGRVLHEVLGDI